MANNRKRLVGRVVSNKMQKTVTVAIERRKAHPIYGKVVITTKKVMAHDESDAIEVGSVVQIVESKPLSRNKRWVVEKVLQKPGEALVTTLPDEAAVLPTADAPDATAEAEANEA